MAGLGLGLLFVTIWASAFTAIKGVVPEWPALWGLAVRFCLVAPLLVIFVRWRGLAWPAPGDRWRVAVMGAFGSGLYLACSWLGAKTLPTGLVALLAATAPLFVAAGEVLVLRQRLPLLAWPGLALGWLGVAVLGWGRGLGQAAAGAGGGAGTGDGWAEAWAVLLVLGGAVSQTIGILTFAPARQRIDPWVANAGQTSAAALVLVVLAALTSPPPDAAPSLTLVLSLAYGIVVVGIGGYALYFVMLEKLPPATAAALQLLAPPLAAVFGWALLGERLAPTDLVGGAITLAGLAVLLRARR